jgi:hypothetical protein
MASQPEKPTEGASASGADIVKRMEELSEEFVSDLQEDERLASGVPNSHNSSDLEFIEMTGMTRPDSAQVKSESDLSAALNFYEEGVDDVDASLTPHSDEAGSFGEEPVTTEPVAPVPVADLREIIAGLTDDEVPPPPEALPVIDEPSAPPVEDMLEQIKGDIITSLREDLGSLSEVQQQVSADQHATAEALEQSRAATADQADALRALNESQTGIAEKLSAMEQTQGDQADLAGLLAHLESDTGKAEGFSDQKVSIDGLHETQKMIADRLEAIEASNQDQASLAAKLIAQGDASSASGLHEDQIAAIDSMNEAQAAIADRLAAIEALGKTQAALAEQLSDMDEFKKSQAALSEQLAHLEAAAVKPDLVAEQLASLEKLDKSQAAMASQLAAIERSISASGAAVQIANAGESAVSAAGSSDYVGGVPPQSSRVPELAEAERLIQELQEQPFVSDEYEDSEPIDLDNLDFTHAMIAEDGEEGPDEDGVGDEAMGDETDGSIYRQSPPEQGGRKRGHRRRRLAPILALLFLVVLAAGAVFVVLMPQWQTSDSLYNKAAKLQSEQEFVQASAAYQEFNQTYPEDARAPQALFLAGLVLQSVPMGLGNQPLNDSKILLQRFVQQNPTSESVPRANILRATAHYRLGEYQRAIDILQDAELRRLDYSASLPALRFLARSYAALEDFDSARGALTRAASLTGNYTTDQDYELIATLYSNQAALAETVGDRDAHLAEAKKYLELAKRAPGIERARRNEFDRLLNAVDESLREEFVVPIVAEFTPVEEKSVSIDPHGDDASAMDTDEGGLADGFGYDTPVLDGDLETDSVPEAVGDAGFDEGESLRVDATPGAGEGSDNSIIADTPDGAVQ